MRIAFLFGTMSLISLAAGCSKSESGAVQASAGPNASSASSSAPVAMVAVGKPPEADLAAAELLDESASKRFKGKFVLVFGTAAELGKDDAGAFVVMPKSAEDPASPKLKCLLKAGQDGAIAARKAGDKVDVAGVVDDAGGNVVLRDCVLDTQLKICQLTQKTIGKNGKCEPLSDKLGVRWSNGTDGVEMACQSPAGFGAWLKDWTAKSAGQTTSNKISVEKTSCRAVIEPVNLRIGVDLTAAMTHLAWIDNTPTLVP